MAHLPPPLRPGRITWLPAGLILAVLWLTGCSRLISLPEVDIDDPQWKVWQGQALWTARSDLSALAGDLIVAQNPDGDILVSFSKPPFPIFTAQSSGNLWRIDFIDKGRSYSGIGRPPGEFIWFRLPGLIEGEPPPKQWEVHEMPERDWSIVNRKTGEKIRVVLDR